MLLSIISKITSIWWINQFVIPMGPMLIRFSTHWHRVWYLWMKNPCGLATALASHVPWQFTSMRLPPPILIEGIGSPIPLASHLFSQVRAALFCVQRTRGAIRHPFTVENIAIINGRSVAERVHEKSTIKDFCPGNGWGELSASSSATAQMRVLNDQTCNSNEERRNKKKGEDG